MPLKLISGYQQNRGSKRPSNHGQSGKGNNHKWFKANPGPTLEANTAFEADASPTDLESTFPTNVPSAVSDSVNYGCRYVELGAQWNSAGALFGTIVTMMPSMKKRNSNKNEILGLSTWDLLEEDFEREAAALGLYYFSEWLT